MAMQRAGLRGPFARRLFARRLFARSATATRSLASRRYLQQRRQPHVRSRFQPQSPDQPHVGGVSTSSSAGRFFSIQATADESKADAVEDSAVSTTEDPVEGFQKGNFSFADLLNQKPPERSDLLSGIVPSFGDLHARAEDDEAQKAMQAEVERIEREIAQYYPALQRAATGRVPEEVKQIMKDMKEAQVPLNTNVFNAALAASVDNMSAFNTFRAEMRRENRPATVVTLGISAYASDKHDLFQEAILYHKDMLKSTFAPLL